MTIYYLDYELGNDASSGSSWGSAWKTITNGATAARIAPGDIIRIAKSASPTSIGNATWTDLSKTVSLTSGSLNPNIDRCEVAWTANPSGDTTVALTAVATDAKEGSYCMKLTLDSSPQTNVMQAYYATGLLDLSAYQKISFWFKNSASSTSADWIVQLCADTAGSSVVDSFPIPAVPSTARWLPLTLARTGGGNCGSAIQSIAISTGSIAPTASSNILVDNFIACTTDGLNLQSLISKSSLESGGTETWYGLQSINGSTLMLDNDTNTKSNAGEGYSGSTETVPTYKRETTKTAMVASNTTVVQEVQDSGTNGNNIQFQGGYNTSTSEQDGETFFDGLNGYGYGIYLPSKNFITLDRLNTERYYYGFYISSCSNITIIQLKSNNNSYSGVQMAGTINSIITNIVSVNNWYTGVYTSNNSRNNTISTITSLNNSMIGIYWDSYSNNNTITTMTTINNGNVGFILNGVSNNNINSITLTNNGETGISFNNSENNTVNTVTSASNVNYGARFYTSSTNNIINSLTTFNNTVSALMASNSSKNTLLNANLGEATKLTSESHYDNSSIFINNIGGYSQIWTDYGNIVSQDATAGGTGLEWKLSVTNVGRASNYPLKLKVFETGYVANKTVVARLYMKKSHATDIAGAFVIPEPHSIPGVTGSLVAYCPNDTNRNLLEVHFLPTGSGVVAFESWAWWLANTADENVIVDSIDIFQG